ncbi:MAG: hypothetical protein WC107_04420 [Patescibacteria group bacterium]
MSTTGEMLAGLEMKNGDEDVREQYERINQELSEIYSKIRLIDNKKDYPDRYPDIDFDDLDRQKEELMAHRDQLEAEREKLIPALPRLDEAERTAIRRGNDWTRPMETEQVEDRLTPEEELRRIDLQLQRLQARRQELMNQTQN